MNTYTIIGYSLIFIGLTIIILMIKKSKEDKMQSKVNISVQGRTKLNNMEKHVFLWKILGNRFLKTFQLL